MGEHDAVKHIVVGDFVCARLDHCDKVSGGGDGDIHIALCSLLESGVDDILTVNKADDNACDGAVPGDLGDRDSDGNAEHSGDLGLAVGINGHNGGDNAHVVPHILGERGRMGLSITREARVAFSLALPSRRWNEPGILPTE